MENTVPTPEKTLPAHIVAAAGVVLNQQGEILLVNTYKDTWVLPGGEVENGSHQGDFRFHLPGNRRSSAWLR